MQGDELRARVESRRLAARLSVGVELRLADGQHRACHSVQRPQKHLLSGTADVRLRTTVPRHPAQHRRSRT